jgi:hypothetical protein
MAEMAHEAPPRRRGAKHGGSGAGAAPPVAAE